MQALSQEHAVYIGKSVAKASNDRLSIRFHKALFFLLCLISLFRSAYCDEIYYIDNSPLFLYKTINWWYDCLPKESKKLCGRPIKCSNTGNIQVEYNASIKRMELKIRGGFASLLLPFKTCGQCFGPSYLHHIWIDKRYFKHTTAKVIVNDSSTISGFTFSNIDKAQAQYIKSITHDLQFILEGIIGGLSNGQIALHESGNFIKRCNEKSPNPDEKYPITLKMINTRTNEIIAAFAMLWER